MITCPSCGAQVPDQDRCPACDYPIILRRGDAAPPARPAPQPGQSPGRQPGPPAFGAGGADPYGANPFTSPPAQGGGYQGGYPDAPLPGLAQGAGGPAGAPAGPPTGHPGYPGYPAGGPGGPGSDPGGAYPGGAYQGGAYQGGAYQGGAYQGGGHPSADGVVYCPNPACRHQNPARRTLCEICGWYLRPQPVAEQATPFEVGPAQPAQPARSNRTPLVLAGIAVALLALGGFAIRGLLSFGGGDDEPKTPAATKPASSQPASPPDDGPQTFVVDPAQVTAKASSVQKAAGSVTYVAANLLDGKPQTAWNSNGDKVPGGKGVTLTFTFDEPLHVRGIAVLNGYQKKIKDGGKTKDLFDANARVAGFEVTTDEQSAQWKLDDVRDPQKFEQDLGTTTQVTLTVTDVYPGAEYEDLAVSEISFLAQR